MADTYIYDMADTWDNGATTFTAIKMNVTDTASNAASLLMDIQRNGVSQVSATKAGGLNIGDSTAFYNTPLLNLRLGSGTAIIGTQGVGCIGLSVSSTQTLVNGVGFGAAANSADTFVLRDGAANTVALRNGTNAQTLRIANTWADPSNNEYLSLGFSGNNAYVTATKLGTGVQRNLTLGGIAAGTLGGTGQVKLWTDGQITFSGLAAARWSINSSGHWYAEADTAYDLGSAGGRARDANIGRNIVLNMTASLGGGVGVINVGNASTAPTTNPTGGGILYCEAGALKFRGTSGTVTTIAAA